MNCQEFNNIIDELADYKPMPDAVRDASVSHAALCPTCAANLADAREVSSHLLQAARAESEEAPAKVKANLLAAFAQSALVESRKSKVESQRQTTLADFRPSTFDFRRKAWFTAAAAIAAVILLAVIFPILRKAIFPVPQPQSSDLAAGPIGAPAPPTPNSNSSSSAVSSDETTPPKNKSQVPPDVTASKPRSTKHRASPNRRPAAENVARNSGEYLPLTYMAKGTAIESGTVVRIELSRFALASLGFNTSGDNSDESVKADVILGDDGVARAIRLVE